MNAKNLIKRVTIIGAGNVGHNFGKAFRQAGYVINEIYSRTQSSALLLSQTLNCDYTTDLKSIKSNTDLIILAINDDALETVINQIKIKDKIIVHSSGSTPLSLFNDKGFKQYGIFYPVQSFSKNETESLENIPICVEGNNDNTENLLYSFAKSVSTKVYAMDSKKRKALHVAAVFANNFTNHMFHIADDLLKQNKISFEIIRPLLEKTAGKLKTETPLGAQTGPAVRNDLKVIESHMEYLKNQKDYQELYGLITANIFKAQKKK
ncbi:MAG: DUF2520 domain-containing protein [Bacteroidetes bacterium]|nr:MAG: DUF2520 domain-containing protein [Bacteroidota bacterium]MBL1144732.1 DUF2520 domain-containing protein [Bacteroidota bacterium]MCB0802465.1 DUF2520 domain-containing protein [Flavobacteriales bacterium]NOG57526.1 DUF2520 domain-containing protein [Bacteroidota bacterium]